MICGRGSGVVAVPVVVEPVVVRNDLAVVPVPIADVQVAVRRVAEMCGGPSVPLPLECSQSCIVSGI